MSFHGPITYRQECAVMEYCTLHAPSYCDLIWWIPGHPFHRHPVKSCPTVITLISPITEDATK